VVSPSPVVVRPIARDELSLVERRIDQDFGNRDKHRRRDEQFVLGGTAWRRRRAGLADPAGFRGPDFARHRLRDGTPLAEVALTAGFADQAHFTRMFASAYGLTPGRYARLHIPEAAPTARAPDGSVRRRWLRALARR
jgi:AraC-like DNA-binding protein